MRRITGASPCGGGGEWQRGGGAGLSQFNCVKFSGRCGSSFIASIFPAEVGRKATVGVHGHELKVCFSPAHI